MKIIYNILFIGMLFLSPVSTFGQTSGELETKPSSEARFPGCERNGLAYEDKLVCADNKMVAFLNEQMKYPEAAAEGKISGFATIQFVVETDGTLSDISIVKTSESVFETEAIRLAHILPNFVPAKKGKELVRSQREITIQFVFGANKKGKKKGKKRDLSREMAKTRINGLKEGILVVRLQTNRNKVAALERLVEEGSVAKRPAYEAQLGRLIFERDSFNQDLMTFFSDENYFDFCPVYFYFDGANELYAKGRKSGYFLNEDFEVDPGISLGDKPNFMAFVGATPSEDAALTYRAIVVKDAETMSPLSPPFPTYTIFRERLAGNPGKQLKYVTEDLPLPNVIQNLNKRLHDFYAKAQEW